MAGVLLSCLFLVISVLDHANARDATTATVGEKAAPAIFPAAWPPIVIRDYVEYPLIETFDDCDLGEYYNQETSGCERCKTYVDKCSETRECCGAKYLICRPYDSENRMKKCSCDRDMEWNEAAEKCTVDLNSQFKFMTAAQMALGIALIISVTALAALTCKMCAHRRRMDDVVRYHRDSGSASLNSVQLFVLGRMRDRPPRYDDVPDKPPEYENMSDISTLPMPRIPVAASRIGFRGRLRLPSMPSAAPPVYDDEAGPSNQETAANSGQDTPQQADASANGGSGTRAPVKSDTPQPAEEPSHAGCSSALDAAEGGLSNPAFVDDNACHM